MFKAITSHSVQGQESCPDAHGARLPCEEWPSRESWLVKSKYVETLIPKSEPRIEYSDQFFPSCDFNPEECLRAVCLFRHLLGLSLCRRVHIRKGVWPII